MLGRTVVALALIGVAALVHASQQRQRVTGLYSNLQYTPSGDVAGAEVLIVYARVTNRAQGGQRESRYFAYVQIAEGSPGEPQLVPAQVASNKVTFTLHGDYADISPFSGSVVGDSLIGQFTNGWRLRLGRRASYWQ